jgi:predicted RNA binding protein YcfA (HicA-like mRNA interferase family)
MPRLVPVSRRALIDRLRLLGFEGPFTGGRHQFMTRGKSTVIVPNPHRSDIGIDLLARLLKRAGLSREEWLG